MARCHIQSGARCSAACYDGTRRLDSVPRGRVARRSPRIAARIAAQRIAPMRLDRSCARLAGASVLLCAASWAQAGTWTRLIHDAPHTASLMLLLSDGTVMVARQYGN